MAGVHADRLDRSIKVDRWDLSTPLHRPDGGLLVLQPGRPVELTGQVGFGMTRLGYSMLAAPSQVSPVVAIDVRGWMSPLAAWEVGVVPDQLVVVRCADPSMWPRVAATVFEGVQTVYAEVPPGVSDRDLRRLAALVRARGVRLALRPVRGSLPQGIGFLKLRADGIEWEGVGEGHGRLTKRRLTVEASGKGAAGMNRSIEVEDDGSDLVRVVSDVAPLPARRAVG